MTQVKIFENETHLEKAINDWISKHSNTIRNIKIKPLGVSPSGDIKVMVIYDKPDEKVEIKSNLYEVQNALYNYAKTHERENLYV